MPVIKKQYLNEIVGHAKNNGTNEVCGIIAGTNNIAEKIYKMSNISDDPELCYFMDPKEQLKIMKEIRNNEQKMIGIYHSHPHSAAYPSKKDVELALYPDAMYVIISLQDGGQPEVKAFRIVDGNISEEEIIS